jgi:enediyne biosynthesis protein E4
MQRRWATWFVMVIGGLAMAAGASWTFAEWRFEAGLSRARADLAAQRFEEARRWLAAQSTERPARAEAAYLLGISERALGHSEAAAVAFSRVPIGSRFGMQATLARARTLIDDLGRYAEAEEVLVAALAGAGRNPTAADLRYTFSQLLYWEGRLDEMRRLLQDGWNTSPDRAGDLHDLWRIDNAPLTFEQIQATVEKVAHKAPDDDRIWLVRANLAIQSGQFAEATRWLDACTARRPDDPVVWHARLRWALAADRLYEVRRCLAHLPATDFSLIDVSSIRAWVAAREGDTEAERTALEELIVQVPGHMKALERSAALASKAGQSDRAAEFRRRKAEADLVKERYYRILEAPGPIVRFAELGDLAEKLGRGFEARGWWFLAERRDPSDPRSAAAVARLGPPRPDSRPAIGATLAALLEDRPSSLGQTGQAPSRAPASAGGSRRSTSPSFRDDAQTAGLVFVFDNGKSPRHQLPETTAGGVGLLDYDGDGRLDVYVVQGGAFPPDPARPSGGDRLFRNRGDGTFVDVTESSGISGLSRGYGHGVAVADFDNDGHPDLFITRWHSYALYRNRADGTFEDVTDRAGLGGDRDWPTSAAFADLDKDGDLDLYVCHYLVWDAEHPTLCPRGAQPDESRDPNRRYDYCMPNPFPARPDHLFRNDGGHFVDVSDRAGIIDRNGRGLGVVAADLDEDGWVDLFVANDTTANYLWHNDGGMKLEETGITAGVACNAAGAFQAGMGTAVGDLDGDGRPDLFVTNFYGESTTFFQNMGGGAFTDRTSEVGLAGPSRYLLGFGIVAFDANNDGRLDLATTNGHVIDLRSTAPLEMPGLLLIGGGEHGRLVDVTESAGPAWRIPRIGRGLAVGDLDNDGRLDLIAIPQGSPLVYLHNQTPDGHSVTFHLEGSRSNRDAVGAVVTITAGGRRQRAWRYGGGSYQSASDPRIHFGLDGDSIEQVEVRWPSGRVDRFGRLEADRGYRLREGDLTPSPLAGFGRRPATGDPPSR